MNDAPCFTIELVSTWILCTPQVRDQESESIAQLDTGEGGGGGECEGETLVLHQGK